MNRGFALGFVLVFLTALVILPNAIVKAQSKTIVVPDDFPTLASAIENATNGDTIFVKDGTYQENAISTNKSLSIVGEGYQSTKINFQTRSYEVDINIYEKYTFYDPAILVNANNFRLSGFSIDSNGGEISINGNSTQITANNFGSKFNAIGSYLFITENTFSNLGLNANYSKMSNNIITGAVGIGGDIQFFPSTTSQTLHRA